MKQRQIELCFAQMQKKCVKFDKKPDFLFQFLKNVYIFALTKSKKMNLFHSTSYWRWQCFPYKQ